MISISAASKTRMNSRPMILRFSSGSLTPASASRKRFWASTTCSETPVAATKSRSTCSASPLRSRPWSTNTQVSRSPIARCTRAAATAESTPPESPQMARRSPIWVRIASICSSTMLTIVQVGRQPAISSRKWLSTCWPCSVCITSGCHCTPARRRSRSSKAATGVSAVEASTANPAGAATTESPWLIQTRCCRGTSARSVPPSRTSTGVRPYSERPVRRTSPPRLSAIAWKP